MGYQLIDGMEGIKNDLDIIAAAHAGTVDLTDENAIVQIIRREQARNFFKIGDQLSPDWAQDGTNTYDLDMDVVSFADALDRNDAAFPAMWLQSHWGLPGVQFDAAEALMYAAQELAAGTTFHFAAPVLNDVPAGNYQFTLEEALPAGGQAMLVKSGTDWTIKTYASATSTEVIETVTCTSGTGGTDLGTISDMSNPLTKPGMKAADVPAGATVLLNHGSCSQYGYNRWAQSAVRQWLNSDAAAGAWWTPQNIFDRPPTQLATLRGFLAGLPAAFLGMVKETKVVTAKNTVTDDGGSEITYDKFFLPSLEQEYIVPQASGVEGSYWPYWKERLELNSPQATGSGGTNPRHIRYAIENHASAQNCRLRAANRGTAHDAWIMTTSGNANGYYYAYYAYRSAPACVIG